MRRPRRGTRAATQEMRRSAKADQFAGPCPVRLNRRRGDRETALNLQICSCFCAAASNFGQIARQYGVAVALRIDYHAHRVSAHGRPPNEVQAPMIKTLTTLTAAATIAVALTAAPTDAFAQRYYRGGGPRSASASSAASRPAPSSAVRSPIPMVRATSCSRATRRIRATMPVLRSAAPAATGRVCRCMTATATSSAGAAARAISARDLIGA